MTYNRGMESLGATTVAQRPPSTTLFHCWTFVAVAGSVLIALQLAEVAAYEGMDEGWVRGTNCFLGLLFTLAQGIWVTLDCRRRGEEVGWWRWAAILFGPIGIAIYLLRTYGLRGIAYVGALLAIDALILAPPMLLDYYMYGW